MYTKIDSRNDFFYFSLAYVCTIIFIFVSYVFSLNFEVKGDTQEYLHAFNLIEFIPFPWGLEFVTSGIMWFINFIGGEFRLFLFVCLLMWSPVVFYAVLSAKNNTILFLIYIFFLLPIFMGNVLFLIRQFHAALFFLFFIFYINKSNGHKLTSFFLMFLSIFSHISAVLWIVLFSKRVRVFLGNPICAFFIVFISFLIFFMQVDVITLLVGFLTDLFSILGFDVIGRKLLFYSSGESLNVSSVGYPFIVLSFCTVFFSMFLLVKYRTDNPIFLLALTQSLLLIVFSDNVVAGNRFGFFSYYFSLPLIVFLISVSCKRIRVFLK